MKRNIFGFVSEDTEIVQWFSEQTDFKRISIKEISKFDFVFIDINIANLKENLKNIKKCKDIILFSSKKIDTNKILDCMHYFSSNSNEVLFAKFDNLKENI